MDFINIVPAYTRGWVGGVLRWGGWWQRLKQRSKMTQLVEFRVAMMCTCNSQRANIPLQGLDRHGPTVGAISGPHC